MVITGTSGFIGGNLARALVARGDEVIGVDRITLIGVPWQQVQLDLADRSAANRMAKVAEGADAVFHLAALPGVRMTAPDIARRRHRDIVVAAQTVVKAIDPSVHLVATSSSSVYGGSSVNGAATQAPRAGKTRACREGDPLSPIGGYAQSKAAMEQLLAGRGRTAIARPFTVMGEGQRPDMAVALWLNAITTGQPLTIFGSTQRTRDFTDVRVVVAGLMAMADQQATGVFNLGAGQPRTLADLIAAIEVVTHRTARVRVVAADQQEVAHTFADTTRLQRDLGIDPSTDISVILRRIVQQSAVAERVA